MGFFQSFNWDFLKANRGFVGKIIEPQLMVDFIQRLPRCEKHRGFLDRKVKGIKQTVNRLFDIKKSRPCW